MLICNSEGLTETIRSNKFVGHLAVRAVMGELPPKPHGSFGVSRNATPQTVQVWLDAVAAHGLDYLEINALCRYGIYHSIRANAGNVWYIQDRAGAVEVRTYES